MNRQVKSLLIVTIISSFVVIILFFDALSDYNYDLIITLKHFWFVFLFPLVFVLLAKKLNSVSKLPIKDTHAEVVGFKKKWDYHGRNAYYVATFKVYENLLWTFKIPAEIFNKMFVGQCGILSYREKNAKLYFVFFSSLENQNQE